MHLTLQISVSSCLHCAKCQSALLHPGDLDCSISLSPTSLKAKQVSFPCWCSVSSPFLEEVESRWSLPFFPTLPLFEFMSLLKKFCLVHLCTCMMMPFFKSFLCMIQYISSSFQLIFIFKSTLTCLIPASSETDRRALILFLYFFSVNSVLTCKTSKSLVENKSVWFLIK